MTVNRIPTPVVQGIVPWPEEFAKHYVKEGWWRERSLAGEILSVCDEQGSKVALVDGDVALSFSSLAARADALASKMYDVLGFRTGDRVVIQLPNCWQFVVFTLGCLRAGIIPVMALPAHRRQEIAYLVEQAEAAAIVVPSVFRGFNHQEMAEDIQRESSIVEKVIVLQTEQAVSQAQEKSREVVDLSWLCEEPDDCVSHRTRWDGAEPSGRDVALFLLSGGTTGMPKLIARTHNDYSYNARTCAEICQIGPESTYLVTLPAAHNFPLACPGILGTLLAGGQVVMAPSPDPERAFPLIDQHKVTATAVVPAIAQRWMDHVRQHGNAGLSSLELLQVGGARIADEVARQVRPTLGTTLQQVFGMAEGLINVTRLDDDEEVICSTQGRPISEGDELRVVDEEDRDVEVGKLGMLLTRGPYTLRGYYKGGEHNLVSFTPDGWYRTGDVVIRRQDGNLVVEGRTSDLINRGGEKISAEEIENLSYRLPQVRQAAVIAMPDPELGERVCLVVVLRPDATLTLEEVREAMESFGVARYKWPERLEVLEELPTTKVGKIDKKALRTSLGQ